MLHACGGAGAFPEAPVHRFHLELKQDLLHGTEIDVRICQSYLGGDSTVLKPEITSSPTLIEPIGVVQ
jgi:hypothetical protein